MELIYARGARNFLNMSNYFDENYVIRVPVGKIGPPDVGCPLGHDDEKRKGTPNIYGRPIGKKHPHFPALLNSVEYAFGFSLSVPGCLL